MSDKNNICIISQFKNEKNQDITFKRFKIKTKMHIKNTVHSPINLQMKSKIHRHLKSNFVVQKPLFQPFMKLKKTKPSSFF